MELRAIIKYFDVIEDSSRSYESVKGALGTTLTLGRGPSVLAGFQSPRGLEAQPRFVAVVASHQLRLVSIVRPRVSFLHGWPIKPRPRIARSRTGAIALLWVETIHRDPSLEQGAVHGKCRNQK